MKIITTPRDADLGVVPAHDADPRTTWLAVFGGCGLGSVSKRFAEEPEHRAIESLMDSLDATTVHVFPPAEPVCICLPSFVEVDDESELAECPACCR